MKRATVTIPDDLARAVDNYVQAQDAPPALTAVVQAALRHYLEERGFLATPARQLVITSSRRGSGRRDVSQSHDHYLARTRK
jgi:metal-responsive CopG/Arc/MetJ family transcriptional regulator